jgi:anti-sigma factor RsiW
VETHAAECSRCAAQLRAFRALRQNVAWQDLRFTAPPSLRLKINRDLPSQVITTSRRSLLKGLAAGSLTSAAAAASIGVFILRKDDDNRILGDAVSAHLRSLQAEHLTDVLSSDRHTVKPWFNGRIDLAPPVIDLTAEGFTLIGGRLEYINVKPVATIVYRRRIHVINLFVGQELGTALPSPNLEMVQGFNVLRWTELGLNFMAVSDIERDELEEFGTKFKLAARVEHEDH